MRSRRSMQYFHVKSTIKEIGKDLAALPSETAYETVKDLLSELMKNEKYGTMKIDSVAPLERYTAMVLCMVRGNIVSDDLY